MGRLLNCPQCHQSRVLRTRPRSPCEHLASFLMVSPFYCPQCSFRFMASRIGLDLPKHPLDRREHLRIPVRLYLSFSGGKVRGEGTVLDTCVAVNVMKSETPVRPDDTF